MKKRKKTLFHFYIYSMEKTTEYNQKRETIINTSFLITDSLIKGNEQKANEYRKLLKEYINELLNKDEQ